MAVPASVAQPVQADVVVVGAGIVGALTAWRLQSAGCRTVIVYSAQFRGGTAASAAVVRTTCEEPDLAAESLSWYRDWSAALPPPLAPFVPSGVTVVTPAALAGTAEKAVRAVAARMPEMAARHGDPGGLPAGYDLGADVAWFEPRSGYADPRLAVLSLLLAHARTGGRALRSRVESVRRAGRVWELRTGAGTVRCDRVVVAAGAATAALLPDPAAVQPVTRHPVRVGMFATPDQPASTVVDLARGLLLRPHRDGLLATRRSVGSRRAFVDSLQRVAGARLPRLAAVSPEATARAEFDLTVDGQPLVGPVDEGLYVAYGFGGRGFKIAPAVTNALTTAVLTGRDASLPRRFRPLRPPAGPDELAELA